MSSTTHYIDIPEVGGASRAKTAVYFPPAFKAGGPLNILLYLHGHRAEPIDKYLADARFPLREKVSASGKNLVLVAPTLTDSGRKGSEGSDGGKLESDPDWYITKILPEIEGFAGESISGVGNLILAAHSGGGRTMFQIVSNLDKYKKNLKQTWGFDCLYGPVGDDPKPYDNSTPKQQALTRPPATSVEWLWTHKMPNLFLYYLGSTAIRSKNLKLLADEFPWCNAVVERSSASDHYLVPQAHLLSRLNAASFLS